VSACSRTASKNAAAISPSSTRSRFLLKVVDDQTPSSIPTPQTSGTPGCSPTAPSAAARCESCTALAAAAPATVARAESTGPGLHIQRPEARRQPLERAIGDAADCPQGVVGWHALVKRDVTEHRSRLLVGSAHRAAPFACGSIVVPGARRVDQIRLLSQQPVRGRASSILRERLHATCAATSARSELLLHTFAPVSQTTLDRR
jgi:hypothetical protein